MREPEPTARAEPGASSSFPPTPVTPNGWIGRHQLAIDFIVVVVVFLYNIGGIVGFAESQIVEAPGWWPLAALVVLSILLCAPYPYRYRYPVPSFAIMVGAAYAQLLLNSGIIFADAMLAFFVFFMATRFRWKQSALAALVVMVWVPLAAAQLFDDGILVLGAVPPLVLGVVVLWAIGTLVRMRREQVEALQQRARDLERERDVQAQIAAAEERTRIAREIHDIVSHSLSVVVLMTDGAISKVRSDPDLAEDTLATARDTGRAAMAEMRRMVGVLRTNESGIDAPQPGLAQIEELFAATRSAGVTVDYSVTGTALRLPQGVDLCIYRVIQEALTNARKHGGPALEIIAVRLHYGVDQVRVTVTDDGNGAVPYSEKASTTGHGLIGMRERVASHGGSLHTGPQTGGGFVIRAALPLSGGA